jgi:peptide alpha-N-acetyltransferase
VVQHFEDFNEDQFDFHAYCIRKVTLRAYVDVLRFEDELLGEDYYGRAASGIIRIFVHLYDQPRETDEDEEPDYSAMSAAEKKKAKAVARKKKKAAEKKAAEEVERRKKQEEEAAANLAAENGSKKKGVNKPGKPAITDADPEGLDFLKRDPLEEAAKLSSALARHAPKRFETWMIQYDVAIRRKKGLLALQVSLHDTLMTGVERQDCFLPYHVVCRRCLKAEHSIRNTQMFSLA